MTLSEKISTAISASALIIAVLTFVFSLEKTDRLSFSAYAGEYSLKDGFSADIKLVFIKSGDYSYAITDVWASISDTCAIDFEPRVDLKEFSPILLDQSTKIVTVNVNVESRTVMNQGAYMVCIYAEIISSNGTRSEKVLGSDELIVDTGNSGLVILPPAGERWQGVNDIFSKKRYVN